MVSRPSSSVRSARSRRAAQVALAVAVLAGLVASSAGNATIVSRGVSCWPGKGGGRIPPPDLPIVEAAFARESYTPGSVARLRIFSSASDVTLRLFRAGTESRRIRSRDVMYGSAVGPIARLHVVRRGARLRVRIGEWESGLYFAKLTASGGRAGFAPFIVRPRVLGRERVAVVLPTHTWQAYNYRDDDGDRVGDTWYCSAETALLGRPFEHRGVPPHYKWYDQPFLRFLSATNREADYLADGDVHAIGSGRRLRRAYELLVFPGHHEYVTASEYRSVRRFRDLGGNLVFLSANNFYWRIVRRGNQMIRTQRWRDLGRPEAGLIGVQYLHSDFGRHRGPWIIRSVRATPWLFSGTRLRRRSRFGNGGLEMDRTTAASPRGIHVVAEIPNCTGTGLTAQMTYYERRGAKVFAAGAFSLAAGSWNPEVQPLLANVWDHLSKP